jgi:hypothetical protein
MKLKLIICIALINVGGSLLADTITIKKTNQIFENVKTMPNGNLETIVESKDGTKQILKTKEISIVTAPVIWDESKKEEKDQRGFFDKRFPEMAIGVMALLFLLLP